MQDGDVFLLLRAIHFVRPSVGSRRVRMTVQLKNFYDALPYCFPVKRFLDGNTLDMPRLYAMQPPDHVL